MLGSKHYETDLKKLSAVPIVRPPGSGHRWKGVKHFDLVKSLLAALRQKGWGMACPQYHLNRNGADFAFCCLIRRSGHDWFYQWTSGNNRKTAMEPAFGIVASNARRRRLTFYCGTSSQDKFGSIVSHKWYGPWYSIHVDVEEALQLAVEAWEGHHNNLTAMVNRIRETDLSDDEVNTYLLTAAHEGIIPWSRIPRVIQAVGTVKWERASWRHTNLTPLRLLTSFSQVIGQMNPPMLRMDQQISFFDIVSKEVLACQENC